MIDTQMIQSIVVDDRVKSDIVGSSK